MNKYHIISIGLVFTILIILTIPILINYHTHDTEQIIHLNDHWEITLYSPNGDKHKTWEYYGQRPCINYCSHGSYLDDPTTFVSYPIKIEGEEIKAPVGWYLDVTNGKENK